MPRSRRWGLVFVGCGLATSIIAIACGDDGGVTSPSPSDASTADTATPDADSSADAGTKETLGGACSSDDACADGLICFHDGVADKWPAHGLCTAKCTTATDCSRFKAGAACGAFGAPQKWCFEPCTQGPPGLDSLTAGPLPSKCHGRADVACQLFLDGSVACRPSCNDDSACEGGFCTPNGGACTKAPVPGWDDVGNVKGSCGSDLVTGTPPAQYCTATCVIGVIPTCRWNGPGTKAVAACVHALPNAGRGDHAECARLCDTDCDCESPLQCEPFSVAAFKTETGRNGVCSGAPATHLPCADAGDGGDGG